MKAWYQSKVVWVGVISTLLGVLQLFAEWYDKGDFSVSGVVALVIGVLVIILRVWFTDTPIDTPKMRATWADEDEPPQ